MTQNQLDEQIWELRVPMFRLAMSILHHSQNAEDAVSSAVLAAYQKLGTLRDDAALKPWLLKITARCCYDLLRRSRRETVQNEWEETVFVEPEEQTLREMLRQLPAQHEQVLTLYYYEGFSIKEIADVLHMNAAAVAMRLSRGRKQLRELLEMDEEDGDAQNTVGRNAASCCTK